MIDRLWEEALDKGTNVVNDANMHGVTLHTYDDKMEKFYINTDAFIFELMVESCRKGKKEVQKRIRDRIDL